MKYRIARIPKGGGRHREIYVVSPEDRLRLRGLLPQLERIHSQLDVHKADYAFQKGRNCAQMALQHIGNRFALSMDLENFFDSITESHVSSLIPASILNQCLIQGCPKQGLPTSPLISSIAFLSCDADITRALASLALDVVYTRYADDLVFSFNNPQDDGKIRTIVKQIVEARGFKLNAGKTRLQASENGRIIIAGIAVDRTGLHPTRRTMKKIRAARHQHNASSIAGLEEWSKCKLPRL